MKWMTTAFALFFMASQAFASDYIVVSVSGFRTIRDKSETENVLSKTIDKSGEDSGVWSNAPTNGLSNKIIKNAYLTHFSKDSEIESVINLFLDETKHCSSNIKMILMVNSWGAKISQRLAQKYEKKCNTKPAMTFMIEGISKPTTASYTKDLISEECINIYQSRSTLRGDKISNCRNFEFSYSSEKSSLFNSHIWAEWHGSSAASESILRFLNNGEKDFSINVERLSYYGFKEI